MTRGYIFRKVNNIVAYLINSRKFLSRVHVIVRIERVVFVVITWFVGANNDISYGLSSVNFYEILY